MTRSRTARNTLALLVLLAVGAAGCVRAPLSPDAVQLGADSSVQGAMQQLPWRITATVAATPAPAPDGCLVFFTTVIEGTATYLGRFTGVGTTCVTDQVAPDPDPPFMPAGPGPYVTATFGNPRWTLTAANGDEVWIETSEPAIAVISLVDNSLKAQGTHRIVGGTGRFAGATGEAAVGAVNDGTQPADDFSGEGWVQFGQSGDHR